MRDMVLVVDDDKLLRDETSTALRRLGYQVLLAGDGVKGLKMFQSHHAEISVVLMDVLLPKMNGIEAAKQMLTVDPAALILFSSGYCPFQLSGLSAVGLLRKPYRVKELEEALEQLMSLERPEALQRHA